MRTLYSLLIALTLMSALWTQAFAGPGQGTVLQPYTNAG